MKRSLAILLMMATAAGAAVPARAQAADEPPSTGRLVLAGAGMAIPTYFLGVAWHEGSHALAAKAVGAEILEIKLLPGFKDGYFYFGYTRWRGRLSRGEKTFALIAPRITDLLLLGGFATLVFTDSLPDSHYGSLALTVLATGAWVDFTKDLIARKPVNDLVQFHNLYGRKTEWQRLPWRLLHLSLSAATGYVVYRGYVHVFDRDGETPPVILPLYLGAF